MKEKGYRNNKRICTIIEFVRYIINYKYCNREYTLETCGLRWLIELRCLCSSKSTEMTRNILTLEIQGRVPSNDQKLKIFYNTQSSVHMALG